MKYVLNTHFSRCFSTKSLIGSLIFQDVPSPLSEESDVSSGDEFVPNSEDYTDCSEMEHESNAAASDVENQMDVNEKTTLDEIIHSPRDDNSVKLGEIYSKASCRSAQVPETLDHANIKTYCFVCKKPQSKLACHFKSR